jgi:tRNA(Ile)-lysidine synthase
MPMLEEELGPGVAEALARTADLLREDADALDRETGRQLERLHTDDGLPIAELAGLDAAIRHRVIRSAAVGAGAIAAELSRGHVLAVAAMALGPDGGKQIQLPGHVTAYRTTGHLRFRRTTTE